MFKRHQRRSTNILFVLFRLCLSVIMLAVLIGGVYSAYKHFSGLDPLKMNPQAIVLGITSKNAGVLEFVNKIPGIKGKLFLDFPRQNSGQVAEKLKKVDESSKLGNLTSNIQPHKPSSNIQHPTSKLVFSFAMVADSHSDNIYLKKALMQIKKDYSNVKFVIGLGDYSEVGTIDELKNAKLEFDEAGIRYFLIPGDHDLWDGRNKSLPPLTNFNQVFGPPFQSFWEGDDLFVLLYNSDNYKGLDDDQLRWLDDQLDKAKQQSASVYVFLHEPLYHPSSDHVMGKVESSLKDQAQLLVQKLKTAGVREVFAGDLHFFSYYEDPRTHLPMVTVGAITSQRNTQAPRFAIGTVYQDGQVEVEDVEIK